MNRYWLGRALQSVPLLFAVSLVVFGALHLAPGDPSTLLADPAYLTAEQQAELRASLGLEEPLPVQYVKTMTGMVDGSLRSFRTREPTIVMLRDSFPVTASVILLGMAVATAVGIVFGTAAAQRPGGHADRLLGTFVVAAISFPTFVLALILIRVFAEELGVLPARGIRPIGAVGLDPLASLPHLIMPVAVTAFGMAPILARYARDAVAEALAQDYVRIAHGKGLPRPAVLRRHVLPNALVSIVSVVGIITPILLGGSVIVETLFGLPGIGRLTVQAALQRDYPVVMTMVMFSAVLVIVANFITDLLYGRVDPRIRLS